MAPTGPNALMASGSVFIAVSLDGSIARTDGSLDWLLSRASTGEDHGYDAFISGVQAIVMGRGTFETVKAFDPWPYTLPVTVLNRKEPPQVLPPKVRFSAQSPALVMSELGAAGVKRAYIDGGLVVQDFLRHGLIDDITITRIPALIGAGRPLFGALPADVSLTHVETRSFPSGFVQSRYRIGD